MQGFNNIKHFDSSKNTLPDNWINSNANGYYNRDYWNRCHHDYGTNNPSKMNADKWCPMATESCKWTKGTSNPHDNSLNKKSLVPVPDPDIAIVYRMPYREMNSENIVDLKIPVRGTKEKYLSNFSPEFIYCNRYQCATSPVYDSGSGNAIDNRRQKEFTPSDQSALTKRGIKNYLFAKQLANENKLGNDTYAFKFPMNVSGRTAYPLLGSQGVYHSPGSPGVQTIDITKGYFRGDD